MTVKQTFTGDNKDLLKAYLELENRVDRMKAKQEELSQKSKKAAEDGKGGLLNLAAAVNVVTATYSALAQAANVAAQAIEHSNEQAAKASDIKLTVAESQAQVLKNLGGVEKGDRQAFLRSIQEIRGQTGFSSLSDLNMAAASGLSASGGNRTATIDAVRASAFLARDKPEELDDLVAAAIAMGKASGNQSAQENLSFMIGVGGVARMPSLGHLAQNAPPAILGAAGTVSGDRELAAREGGALFAALSNPTEDVTGASTKTATISLAVQLRDFFREQAHDPGTIAGRISALQADPEARGEFLSHLTGEKQYQVPIEQLLSGGYTADVFQDAKEKIRFGVGDYVNMVDSLEDDTSELRQLQRDRELAGLKEGSYSQIEALRGQAIAISNDVRSRESYLVGSLDYLNAATFAFDGDDARIANFAQQARSSAAGATDPELKKYLQTAAEALEQIRVDIQTLSGASSEAGRHTEN